MKVEPKKYYWLSRKWSKPVKVIIWQTDGKLAQIGVNDGKDDVYSDTCQISDLYPTAKKAKEISRQFRIKELKAELKKLTVTHAK